MTGKKYISLLIQMINNETDNHVCEKFFKKLKEVIDITAETGALETQRRIRELSRITYPEQSRSAQLEQKKGKWLTQTQYCNKHNLVPSGLGAYFWCSCCEEAVERLSNFCPNCGADMRGDNNADSN